MKERPKTGAFLLIAIALLGVYLIKSRLLSPEAVQVVSTEARLTLEPASAGARLVLKEQIDINIATAEDLALLPGIGSKLSQSIIEERLESGRYNTIDDLRRVKGLSPGRIKRIVPYITTGG